MLFEKIVFKVIVALLVVTLLCTVAFIPCSFVVSAEATAKSVKKQNYNYKSEIPYHDYMLQYVEKEKGKDIIKLQINDIIAQSGDVTITENLNGRKGKCAQTGESASITYGFTVSNEGLYQISVDYYPTKGKGSTIVRSFEIDGKIPFEEVREVDFLRCWKDKENIAQDSNGNDIHPAQEESPCWLKKDLMDNMGYYT